MVMLWSGKSAWQTDALLGMSLSRLEALLDLLHIVIFHTSACDLKWCKTFSFCSYKFYCMYISIKLACSDFCRWSWKVIEKILCIHVNSKGIFVVALLVVACGLCWQVFINAAVTQPVVCFSELERSYYVVHQHSAVLSDTRLVMKLLLSWRLWDSAADSVWLLAINALNSLVQADHPRRQYNVNQLYDAGIIAKMLDIWKVCRYFMICCILKYSKLIAILVLLQWRFFCR